MITWKRARRTARSGHSPVVETCRRLKIPIREGGGGGGGGGGGSWGGGGASAVLFCENCPRAENDRQQKRSRRSMRGPAMYRDGRCTACPDHVSLDREEGSHRKESEEEEDRRKG